MLQIVHRDNKLLANQKEIGLQILLLSSVLKPTQNIPYMGVQFKISEPTLVLHRMN